MWHGESVEPSAVFCPFKGGERFETTLTPQTTKICRNPDCPRKRIHVREIFCEYCGIKQPAMGTTETTTTTTTAAPPPPSTSDKK
jgi:hypothetical protein